MRDRLRLDSTAYGLLLASVGIGAVVAALATPPMRSRVGTGAIVGSGSASLALASVIATWVTAVALVAVALAVAGAGWIATISTRTGASQVILPTGSARGMSVYLTSVMGSHAAGAALWGAVSESYGVRTGLTAMGAAVVVGLLADRRWPVHSTTGMDLNPSPRSEPPLPAVGSPARLSAPTEADRP